MTSMEAEPDAGRDRGQRVRWDGTVAVLLGLLVNEWTLEWTVVPDGEIGSAWIRLFVAGLQLLLISTGVYLLIRRPEWKLPWGRVGLAAAGAGLAWFACFAVLDLYAPGMVDLPGVKYFEYRQRFRPDSTLVMVPRRKADTTAYRLRGDLAGGDDGLPPLDLPYHATYNDRGFRTNLGEPPWDAVIIGDSFVEFGEADSLTVSAMLRRASGLSTFNLGRGWYGPHQYLELLRRYGLSLDPEFAILCFFGGNDPKDVLEYRKWRTGGSYYDFALIEGSLVDRFVKLNNAVLGRLQRSVLDLLDAGPGGPDDDATAGGRRTLQMFLSGERSPMRFAYWPDPTRDPDALLEEEAWQVTEDLMASFEELATRAGIRPVVVFIPAKLTVYRPFLVSDGAPPAVAGARGDATESLPSPRAEALRRITEGVELAYLDLTPLFRRRAARGDVLYYRQDTHWTLEGRQAAADTIADFLRVQWPEKLRSDDTAAFNRSSP